MRISFIVHDNDKTVNDFPLGVGYLVSYLIEKGMLRDYISIYNMDVYHYSDEELYLYLTNNSFDAICIGMIAGYWQYRQLKRIFNVIGRLKKRPVIILGGFMFTPAPEFFLSRFDADFVVLGEGEVTLSKLIEKLGSKKPVHDIGGLAFRLNGDIIVNPPLAPIKNIDSIPFPAWDMFPIEAYVPKVRIPAAGAQRSMPVISSRGCIYHCAFCYRMVPGYRKRSYESVIEEVERLTKDFKINAICFRDELLMSTPQRAIEFANAILKAKLKIHFDIDGRLNAANAEALKLLKKAGCVYINYGVESLDQLVLDNMNKKQTIAEIIKGVELTLEAGIHPGLNIIYGSPGDNRETARKTVAFLLKYNTYGEIRTLKPVTPYPGSKLFELAVAKGLIKDVEDFYENKHLNSDLITCNFTELSEDECYEVLFESNKVLLENHFTQTCKKQVEAHKKLYYNKDTNFRGVRA